MPIPQHFTEQTTSNGTSTLPSPPFKPFQPLPEIPWTKPPTPPPKLLDLPPYRDTLSYLSHPTPKIRSKALEIIRDREKTDIHRVREEWKRQDGEREKAVREKEGERERLIGGASTVRAPNMQTVTALVVDPAAMPQPPPPPPPKKEKKPFWRKLFQSSHSRQPAPTNGPVIIPIPPQQVLPSVPGGVVPMQEPSQSHTSSSTTHQSPRHAVRTGSSCHSCLSWKEVHWWC